MTKARDIASAAPAPAGVTSTELGYVDGVTSALQTQINSKIGQTTAINPAIVDAKGDIIAATAADTVARLAVGANNTVLTADSAEATGLKWATPSAGAMVYLGGASFTGSSSQSLNNVFTSTYTNYLIMTNIDSVSTAANILFRLRASGTDSTASYYSNIMYNDLSAGNINFGNLSASNANAWKIADLNSTGSAFGFTCTMFSPQRSVTTSFESGSHGYNYSGVFYQSFTGGIHNSTTQYDGITILPAAGTMTGTIRIYGIVNS